METVHVLAKAFADNLKAELSADDWKEMRRLNATAEFDWPICASHNFCDANMPMADAFEKVCGFPALSDDGMSDENISLWNQAWKIAKLSYLTDKMAREFPDYDPADLPAIPADWLDISWHNDACPSWQIDSATLPLFVYVDYADATRREFPEISRFSVHWEGDCLFESDDWNAILVFVAARLIQIQKGN